MLKNIALLRGNNAEKIAARYFKKNGFTIVCKNYYCRFGEIDLITKKDDILIFVEVKYRINNDFGRPEEFVTHKKQQKIIITAQDFLQKHQQYADYFTFRFDILAISGRINDYKIDWIQSAFTC